MSVADRDPIGSRDPPAAWERMLRARPIRNAAAELERAEDGAVRITVRKRPPRWLTPLAWVFRPHLTDRYELDALGAQVWSLCDGQRSVEQIVDACSGEFELTFHEARAAVTGYLRDLVRRGVVAMAMSEDAL